MAEWYFSVRYRPPLIIGKISGVLQTVIESNRAEHVCHSLTEWSFVNTVLMLGIPEKSQVSLQHININADVSGYFPRKRYSKTQIYYEYTKKDSLVISVLIVIHNKLELM